MKVLFVCLGNICRSPLAEGVFRHQIAEAGLADQVEVDSAGTAGYHVGDLPDHRSRQTAQAHGITLAHRGRQVKVRDFTDFDYLLAMDQDNLYQLQRMAPGPGERRKVHLFREWDPAGSGEIPDPYYGTRADFEEVFLLCDRAGRGLLAEVQGRLCKKTTT